MNKLKQKEIIVEIMNQDAKDGLYDVEQNKSAVEWLYDVSKKRELDKFDLDYAKKMEANLQKQSKVEGYSKGLVEAREKTMFVVIHEGVENVSVTIESGIIHVEPRNK